MKLILYFFCIAFFLNAANISGQFDFTSSNLPIVVINTNGQQIPDEPKILADMGIIYNGEGVRNYLTDLFNNYNGKIGIKLRGNVTQTFPKKPYGFETWNSSGNDTSVSLIGLPVEEDWVLLAAYIDKTLMRDPIAFRMSQLTSHWASRLIHVELVLNGQYQGVYLLGEAVKRDNDRVDITKLNATDISGDSVTGGYIYEVAQDGPDFGLRRRFVYPDAEDIQPEQTEYIKNYDDGFREVMEQSTYDDSLIGYPAWIDVDYFIDEILVQEACKNSDAYGWSSYFHKDRLGKLRAGPVWDFDQSLSNSTFNDGPNYQEWVIEIIEKPGIESWVRDSYPTFWIKLFREQKFKEKLIRRWTSLRNGRFFTDSLLQFIDQTAAYLQEAQERNFQRWSILGVELWRSTPGWDERDTYQKEVDYLKDFFVNRLNWMDSQLQNTITSDISIINASFENPGTEKIKGWDGECSDPDWNGLLYDIPGWSSDSPAWDSGVETGYPSEGEWAAFLMGGDTSVYQVTEHLIDINDNIELIVDSKDIWQATLLKLELFYQDNDTRVTLLSDEFSISDDMTPYTILFSVSSNPEAIGYYAGVLFDNISSQSQSWLALDNVRLVTHRATEVSEPQMNPTGFSLAQNYPNPFNPSTILSYSLLGESIVTLKVYDIIGREIATLIQNETKSAGNYEIIFDTKNLSSGVYFYRLQTENFNETKKMLLMR